MASNRATAQPTMPNDQENKPESVGEELYLIHLRRGKGMKPREEDFDREAPRKRSHSLGEELWDVHLKRSRGLEPDRDGDLDICSKSEADNGDDSKKEKTKEQAPQKNRSISLRTRVVSVENQ